MTEQKAKHHNLASFTSFNEDNGSAKELSAAQESGNMESHRRQGSGNFSLDGDEALFQDSDGKLGVPGPSGIYHPYETKVAALIRKNGILEGQLAAALANRETAEKNLSAALKSRQEMEKKLSDTTKEMELLKEKLAGVELAQEEANSLSNIVHSDNVRLEHDVAFLKAVLDDTQKVSFGLRIIGLAII